MVEIVKLCKSFSTSGGPVNVLNDINLEISAGERVAVVGTSGAGKTTLLHILGGLDRPSSGDVFFEGEKISNFRGATLDAFRNRSIGFVFQFHQLLPEFSALENVMMPLLIAGVETGRALSRATTLLQEVGLEKRLSHKPGALSGGEQQRVAIARALICEPRLLLADEPTGNLDSRTSDDILGLLNHLHQSRGLTLVMVTHNAAIAGSLDRVLRLDDGNLIEDVLN